MGVYVYTIRKNPIRVELDDGTTVLAACLAYAYKPSYNPNARFNRAVGRINAASEAAIAALETADEVPTHVVFFDTKSKEAYNLTRVHSLPEQVYDDTWHTDSHFDESLGHVERVRVGRRKVYRQVNLEESNRRELALRAEKIADGRIVVGTLGNSTIPCEYEL